MDLYDGLDYQDDRLSINFHKPKVDDPCTIEFGNLDDIPLDEVCVPDATKCLTYPDDGSRVKDLVIPFKGVGRMTVKLSWNNELYGYLHDDQPIRYDVSRGLWHRCPPNYYLCYGLRQLSIRWLDLDCQSPFNYVGYTRMGELSPLGEQVIKLLSDPDVSADQAVKVFKSYNIKLNGKLVKVFGGGWLHDGDVLNVQNLLVSNCLIQ